MCRSLPSIYLITDRHQTYRKRDLLETIEELLQAGVRMIQLREKDLSAAELFPLAQELRDLTFSYHSLLLINDRVDLAQAINADGVHLGCHSLPIEIVRQVLGPKFLIGASTHTHSEIELCSRQGADFVTYGPIYFTPSKAAYGKPAGVQSLQDICIKSSLPIYALGGVKKDNAHEVLEAGATGIAAISALVSPPSPTQAFQDLAKIMTQHKTKA
ncbi:thiamine phosphate synthase [uncultured Desulfuromusa sp.]|uniref:thiamine phosphate synthase n=1 Tax=uncultured Desulfuromusa sp. TaxID=219183 RepID=UPI002AA7DDC3|nr:thiamine phosphate synthase [uncultured Desulfuromusa sp.]